MQKRLRSVAAGFILVTSCQPYAAPIVAAPRPLRAPAVEIAAARGRKIELTRRSGAVIELKKARLIGDSVIGRDPYTPFRIAVALEDIDKVQRPLEKGGSELGHALMVVTVLVLGGFILIASQMDGEWMN